MLLFYKLVQETQMSTPPKATRCHNLTKLLILLPLRDNSKSTFQCETPCTNLAYRLRTLGLSYNALNINVIILVVILIIEQPFQKSIRVRKDKNRLPM